AKAEDGDLAALPHDVSSSFGDDVQALLVHETGDHSEERPPGWRQAESRPHQIRDPSLAAEVAGFEAMREMRVAARIPALVDAVEDARQATFCSNALGEPVQPPAKRLGGDLARIGRADGRDMVGVVHAGLQERNPAVK